MLQPLFIQPDIEFEKTAGEVDLPEDPNVWPKEILDELYKQVPYIADFRPHVVMTKVDAERGYGFGHVEITNQSEAQMGTSPEQMQAAGIRNVRIPVIIKDKKLSPFDLIVNDSSKCLPLTESRLRQALFRPQAFDITSKTPGDQSLIGALYPPFRQNYGFGGGGIIAPAGDMGKMSSAEHDFVQFLVEALEERDAGFRPAPTMEREKEAAAWLHMAPKEGSLLEDIAPTITETDLNGFWEKLAAQRGLQAAFRANGPAASEALYTLSLVQPTGLDKTAAAVANLTRPDVVQLKREHSGYRIKVANSSLWAPVVDTIGRGEMVRRFGEKVAFDVDTAGAVTLADGCDAREERVKQAEYVPVSEAGVYKVQDEEGKELVGFVIPNLVDTDGEVLPMAMFTNGSQATVQGEIFGEPAGDGANLPTATPGGYGAFFEVTQDGELRATIPMTLAGSYAGEDGVATMSGETYDGRPVEVSVQPNIVEPVGTPEGKLLLPQTWQWTPLEGAAQVALAGGDEPAPEMSEEEAEKASSAYVTVRSSGDTFSFSGGPVEKLGWADREMLDLDDAMFLLAGLGVHQGYGATKLAHATVGGEPERILVGRQLRLASEAMDESMERAKLAMAKFPSLKRDLVKEAAFIPDPTAVDTVLSIGFINPENLMTFISYLPSIDDAQSKLCDLLMAARLGIKDVPATALERAVRSLEEVIEGLKVIAFQGM